VAPSEFSRFLSSRRARISPLDVGFPLGARRRVPGLRRDEVATLAGISVEYYTELEQGRGLRPSAQILMALSRALRLARDETEYMYALVGMVSVPTVGPSAHVEPALLDLLHRLRETPAQIMTDLYEVLVRNDLATALLGPAPSGPGPQASVLYRWFADPDRARDPYSPQDHPTISASYVADLRASSGRYPNDRRIQDFIATLTRHSTEFATLWSTADVEVRRSGQHAIRHETLGAIDLECTGLLNETGRQRLIWYTPRIGGTAVTQLQLLSAVRDQFSTTARALDA
jgi:transcriptional regulator with XRE-family HTH domain